MDFLKTLLIYMTMTLAMTVQEAPAPGAAPEITAVPEHIQAQSIGTPTPVPEYTIVPTQTPKPADPTRSAPTITPNARYKTVQYGDRGNDVKKLQKRLIELGYMKKGADDGSYGYQTLNAVRDFQKANGLSVDGAAGRVTLTCLYEDPNVVAKAVPATATPVATPTPPAPALTAPITAQPDANAATAVPDTQPTAAPEATDTPVLHASVTDSWQKVDRAEVLLNGSTLTLLQRMDDVVIPRKLGLWLRDGMPMISLDDLVDASGTWRLSGDISSAQLTVAGHQVMLTAVGDVTDGTCQAYAMTVDGMPCAVNDGDIVCSHSKWYAAPTFLTQIAGTSAMWDADEMTMVIITRINAAD